MNRAQWYTLLANHRLISEEVTRLLNLLPDDCDIDVWTDRLQGLVQCCANVASRIDNTRPELH
jgi:hypothetical protein